MNKHLIFSDFLDKLTTKNPVMMESIKEKFSALQEGGLDGFDYDLYLDRQVAAHYDDGDSVDPDELADEQYGDIIGYTVDEDLKVANVYEKGALGTPDVDDEGDLIGLKEANIITVDGKKYIDTVPVFDSEDDVLEFIKNDGVDKLHDQNDLMTKMDEEQFRVIMKLLSESKGSIKYITNSSITSDYISELRYLTGSIFPKMMNEQIDVITELFNSKRNLLYYISIFPVHAQLPLIKKFLPQITEYLKDNKHQIDSLNDLNEHKFSPEGKKLIYSSLGK